MTKITTEMVNRARGELNEYLDEISEQLAHRMLQRAVNGPDSCWHTLPNEVGEIVITSEMYAAGEAAADDEEVENYSLNSLAKIYRAMFTAAIMRHKAEDK